MLEEDIYIYFDKVRNRYKGEGKLHNPQLQKTYTLNEHAHREWKEADRRKPIGKQKNQASTRGAGTTRAGY